MRGTCGGPRFKKAETDSSPAAAGCLADTVPEDEAPVSTDFGVREALVDLKRKFAFPSGRIAISTSGKSDEVKPVGTHGSALDEGDNLQG